MRSRTFPLIPVSLSLAALLSGCGGGGDEPAASARCQEAETSAEDNRERYLRADAEESAASDEVAEAEAEIRALQKKTRETDVSTYHEIGEVFERKQAAEARQEDAAVEARTNGRLFAQIIIGESECFTPEQVARAREVLSATD